MADINKVKERGLEQLQQQYIHLTRGVEDDNGVVHPNGVGPWAGDASKAETSAWQQVLDETGAVPPDARLTRHLLHLAKWVAATEEFNSFENPDDVPPKVQKACERAWNAKPKEPKVRERKQTIQMFLALPPGLTDKYGGFPQGILWESLENPLDVAEVGRLVAQQFPDKTYKNDATNRARIDIGKFNNAAFPCMEGIKPETKYPLKGLPKKEKPSNEENPPIETASA